MDGTQYLIDIAAKSDDADTAAERLLRLAESMAGVSGAAGLLDASTAQVEAALGAAGAAARAAEADLAQAETRYKELEVAAGQTARALERAGQKTSGSVPADLKTKADAASAALRAHAKVLDDLKVKATGAAAAETRLTATLGNLQGATKRQGTQLAAVGKQAGGAKLQLQDVSELFQRIGGSAGGGAAKVTELAGTFGKLKQGLSGGGGAAAALALVAAIGFAVSLMTVKLGVGMADAARSAQLTTAALEQTSDRLRGLGAAMPEVAAASGLAGDDIRDLAKQLDEAKVSAGDMPRALRAVALAEAALGKGGAAKFIEQLKDGKISVGALAAEVEAKFDGIVSKKLLGLEAQSARLKANLGETFGGLDIEGFLGGLSKMVGLFDQNTASGQALKFLFETLVQPLVDAFTRAFPVVERFFLGIMIGALKIYIAMKPVIRTVQELFGQEPGTGLEDALTSAQAAGEAIATVLFVVGAVVAFVTMRFVSLGGVLVGYFQGAYSVVAGVLNAIYTIVMGVVGVIVGGVGLLLGNEKMIAMGENMVGALADGIVAAGGAVVDAITGVVGDAIGKAKALLGIASPSKVFTLIGKQTSEGFAGGVDAEAPRARRAMTALVAPPAAGGAGGGRRGGSVSFDGATFTFVGVKDAEHARDMFAEMLTRVLEGDALQSGASLEPVT